MKIGVAKHEPKLWNFQEYGGRAAFVGLSPRSAARLYAPFLYTFFGRDDHEYKIGHSFNVKESENNHLLLCCCGGCCGCCVGLADEP